MSPGGAYLEVLAPGPLALVEDLGRPGLSHLGVTRSGAADRRSHALANRLVANPDGHATVEITLGGFTARLHGGGREGIAIAVTGADANPSVDGKPFGSNSIHHMHDGQVIALDTPRAGLRSYLAVRGGIDVEVVLGSRSFDALSAIGPAPLRRGDVLPIGAHSDDFPEVELAPVAALSDDPLDLDVVPGPRDDWFVDPDILVRTNWQVTDRSDRVGVRLVGMPLEYRSSDRQLPSEGATRGSIQVPPNGFPVILGPDHPVTGGYPVIGVLTDDHADRLAQARPGQTIRLHWSRPRHPPDTVDR
ncbi:biotin-dependent carboxyltransferase family protein [Mycobacterium sp. pV006]|uniref:biotin-dependent carboxyltransferase family protein n=1 Tax=Mycobacterium sp. pV006 TaxID=3238983 RepID=UPI00351B07F4